MSETKSNNCTIPYSQHFRCLPDMVGSTENQAVLLYLWDEYLHRYKTGGGTTFKVSANKISAERHVVWRTVKKVLSNLEQMKIISMSGDQCTFYGETLFSLVVTFYNLKERKQKDEFIIALQDGDYTQLRNLGYIQIEDFSSILDGLKGNIMLRSTTYAQEHNLCLKAEVSDCDTEDLCLKAEVPDCDTEKLCLKAEPMLKSRSETYALKQNLCLKAEVDGDNRNEDLCFKAEPMLKSRSIVECLRSYIRHHYSKEDLEAIISALAPDCTDSKEAKILAETTYSAASGDICETGGAWLWFFGLLLAAETDDDLCLKAEGVMLLSRILNKIINNNIYNNKININKKLMEGSEASLPIGGRNTETVENFPEEPEGDLEAPDEELPAGFEKLNTELADFPVPIAKCITIGKAQRKLNKFSADEVDEIIGDIHRCVDSPAKIFINRFWSFLEEGLIEDREEDEDDEERLQSIEGETVGAEFVRTCMKTALEETNQLLQDKRLSPDDEELPVVDGKLSEDDVEIIMGWKKFSSTQHNSEYYTISKTDFYNPASKIEEEPERRGRRSRRSTQADLIEREEDYQYAQKIMLIGETDAGYEKLTPFEKFIYNFSCEYMNFDDDLRAVDTKIMQAGWKALEKIRRMEFEVGLKRDDWKLIRYPDRKNGDGTEKVIARMFKAKSVRAANKERGYTSIVDETSLEALLSDIQK